MVRDDARASDGVTSGCVSRAHIKCEDPNQHQKQSEIRELATLEPVQFSTATIYKLLIRLLPHPAAKSSLHSTLGSFYRELCTGATDTGHQTTIIRIPHTGRMSLEEIIATSTVLYSDALSDSYRSYCASSEESSPAHMPSRKPRALGTRMVMNDKDKTIYNSLGSSSSPAGKVMLYYIAA